MMRALSIITILFAVGFASTVQALCDNDKSSCTSTPRWTPATLTAEKSLHDGPNCFNAALVSAGFMDELVYVDSLEYAFYLEFFCEVQLKNKTAAGNLLVYLGIEPTPLMVDENDTKIMHGAFSLGAGKIIEKTSNAGSLYGKREGREFPGVYKIKPMSASPFAIRASGVKSIISYRCQSRDDVKKKIAILNSDPLAQQIIQLRIQFTEKLKIEKFSKITGFSEQIKNVTAALNDRGTETETDLYTAALARSLVGTIESAMNEQEENYNNQLKEDLNDLISASFDFMEKINTKSDFSRTKPLLLKY